MKSILVNVLITILVFIGLTLAFAEVFLYHPEKYDSVAKYHLLISLESGDKAALKYYREQYVVKGDYLFEGPITFGIVCELYSVRNCQEHYKSFIGSGLSLKKYVYRNFQ